MAVVTRGLIGRRHVCSVGIVFGSAVAFHFCEEGRVLAFRVFDLVGNSIAGISMSLSSADFRFICDLVMRKAAIVLEDGKEYLVESRMSSLARREGYSSIGQMVEALRSGKVLTLGDKVVDAMTTNETSFFRDIHPFQALEQVLLPELIKLRQSQKTLTFWSAASSTGQEAYSIAMMLRESFPVLKDWRVMIVGTDISDEVLLKAKSGRFTQLEVNRGLSAKLLVKYFRKEGNDWFIVDDIKKMVRFDKMNLVDQWPHMARMDIVMLRNVLIYFNTETKKKILENIRKVLPNDGYLFLGAAETTMNLDDNFTRVNLVKTSCYKKAS